MQILIKYILFVIAIARAIRADDCCCFDDGYLIDCCNNFPNEMCPLGSQNDKKQNQFGNKRMQEQNQINNQNLQGKNQPNGEEFQKQNPTLSFISNINKQNEFLEIPGFDKQKTDNKISPQVTPLNPNNNQNAFTQAPSSANLKLSKQQENKNGKNIKNNLLQINNFIGPPPEYPIKPIGPLRFQNNTNKFNNNNSSKSKLSNEPFDLNDPDLDEITHPFEKPILSYIR